MFILATPNLKVSLLVQRKRTKRKDTLLAQATLYLVR